MTKTRFPIHAILGAAAVVLAPLLVDAQAPAAAPAKAKTIPVVTEIRSPDKLAPDVKQKIEAAVPSKPFAKPKKARKLLVMDLQVNYPGHRSIPHAHYAVDMMGKKLGTWQATFSNEMSNLKWENLRQYDALYLNNTVGPLFNDPEVRASLLRFIREGGGLIGNHGSTFPGLTWPEFAELIGAKGGAHRDADEKVTFKIDDPKSPLTRMIPREGFVFQDEYFRYKEPYSRENLHILMSIDVAKTDMKQGRDCAQCPRPDDDYAISWIRSYGKGRVYYISIGHNPDMFSHPVLMQHFLAGIQFALGDLKADTKPSAKKRGS